MTTESIAAIASVVVAVAALIFSILSFNRQQVRAEQQQLRSEKLATDSVKPLLWIQPQNYTNMKSIQLRNFGMGPAVIKLARFEKDGRITDNVIKLFSHLNSAEDLGIRGVSWVTYVNLPPKRVIAPGADISLVKQSLQSLRSQGVNEAAGLELLRRIQQQKKSIKIRIEYLDIFGNEMEPLEWPD